MPRVSVGGGVREGTPPPGRQEAPCGRQRRHRAVRRVHRAQPVVLHPHQGDRGAGGEIADFCIPCNPYFPTPRCSTGWAPGCGRS
ncbi:hypothetical protein ACFQ60_37495 [Streptomyces zhihengii]